jgi:signal transduction histidine kinase
MRMLTPKEYVWFSKTLLITPANIRPHGKQVEISLSKRRSAIYISIQDEGVGIDTNNLDKLFRTFSRIDNPLSIAVGGTGLGLYWAKKIVDLHTGSIEVESTVGKGSTFTIILPAGV